MASLGVGGCERCWTCGQQSWHHGGVDPGHGPFRERMTGPRHDEPSAPRPRECVVSAASLRRRWLVYGNGGAVRCTCNFLWTAPSSVAERSAPELLALRCGAILAGVSSRG